MELSVLDELQSGKTSIGKTRIMLFGLGGCGGNSINNIAHENIEGVVLVAANTDIQSLDCVNASIIIPLGTSSTNGLGAGGKPGTGEKAAEEVSDKIKSVVTGMDMVFITAGMGGGTGTGAASVVARIAKEAGCLTVAIVTTPFRYESKRIKAISANGLKKLYSIADKVIEISNENLFEIVGKDKSVDIAYRFADDILKNSVLGITRIIKNRGTINVDFADVKAVMEIEGKAIMGMGSGNGEGRAMQAVKNMIDHPLMGNLTIKNANGVLAMVSYSKDLIGGEFEEIGEYLQSLSSDDAHFKIGQCYDESIEDEISIILIITGFNNKAEKSLNDCDGTTDFESGFVDKIEFNKMRNKLGMQASVPPVNSKEKEETASKKNLDHFLTPTWKRWDDKY